MSSLEIKDLVVSVEGKTILNGIDLVVESGSVHAIMGPNGSGKSTLSLAIMGHPKYKVERGARPRMCAGAHGVLAKRHRADAARNVQRLQRASRRKLLEDAPHRFDLRRIRRSDDGGPKRKRHGADPTR